MLLDCDRSTGDDRWLASGSDDGSLRFWDLAEKSERARIDEHSGPVYSVRFYAGGDWLASGSEDATIRLSNLKILLAPRDRLLNRAQETTGWVLQGTTLSAPKGQETAKESPEDRD